MDRFNESVNERITADDLNRPELIRSRAVLHSLLGPLTGGTLAGYLAADLSQGVYFGLNVTTPGAVKTVDVSPGSWVGHDATIVNPYDNPRTMGRKEVAETAIAIADATATFEKLYLISVPTTRSALESNSDLESRDIKNPTTGVLGPETVAKRVTTILANVTVTAGTEVAGGTIDLTDTPAHDKWTGVNGIDTHGPALPAGHIPVAIIFKDDTANIVAGDIHDARQMSSIRGALDVQIHNSAVYPKSAIDLVPNLGLAKTMGIFEGAGAANPVIHVTANVRTITRSGVGLFNVTLNRPFAVVRELGMFCMFHPTGGRQFAVDTAIASVPQIRLMDSAGAAIELAATERISFVGFGAQ